MCFSSWSVFLAGGLSRLICTKQGKDVTKLMFRILCPRNKQFPPSGQIFPKFRTSFQIRSGSQFFGVKCIISSVFFLPPLRQHCFSSFLSHVLFCTFCSMFRGSEDIWREIKKLYGIFWGEKK